MVVQEATGGAQAFQQSHTALEAAGIQQEEDAAAADVAPEGLRTSVDAAGNAEADDIFGPAHEFD